VFLPSERFEGLEQHLCGVNSSCKACHTHRTPAARNGFRVISFNQVIFFFLPINTEETFEVLAVVNVTM
jgi:hypothetical protein